MKTLSLIIAAMTGCLFLSSSSCDHHKSANSVKQKYEGVWRYIGYSGGYAGFPFKKDSLRQSFLRIKDSTYTLSTKGQQQCGVYHVVSKIEHGYVPGPYLLFDQKKTGPAIRLKKDTLILIQPVADGMSDWYIKTDTTLAPCPSST